MDTIIRCQGCLATTARGDLAQQTLSQEQVLGYAEHNPGCPVHRADHRTVVHQEIVTNTRKDIVDEQEVTIQEQKQVFTLLVFPAYHD